MAPKDKSRPGKAPVAPAPPPTAPPHSPEALLDLLHAPTGWSAFVKGSLDKDLPVLFQAEEARVAYFRRSLLRTPADLAKLHGDPDHDVRRLGYSEDEDDDVLDKHHHDVIAAAAAAVLEEEKAARKKRAKGAAGKGGAAAAAPAQAGGDEEEGDEEEEEEDDDVEVDEALVVGQDVRVFLPAHQREDEPKEGEIILPEEVAAVGARDGATTWVQQPQRLHDGTWELVAALEMTLGCLVGSQVVVRAPRPPPKEPHATAAPGGDGDNKTGAAGQEEEDDDEDDEDEFGGLSDSDDDDPDETAMDDDMQVFSGHTWFCQTSGDSEYAVWRRGSSPVDMPVFEGILKEGDVVYVPPGAHFRLLTNPGSACLTVQSHAHWRWGDLALNTLQVASKEQPSPGFDEELAVLPDALQRTLPPGLLQDLGLAGATGPGAAGKGGSWAKTGKALAEGLRALAARVEEAPEVALTAPVRSWNTRFMSTRLRPPPSFLLPRGPKPTLDDALVLRAKGVFALLPTFDMQSSSDEDDEDEDDFDGPYDGPTHLVLATPLYNRRLEHMMPGVQSREQDDSDDDEDDEDDDHLAAHLHDEDDDDSEEEEEGGVKDEDEGNNGKPAAAAGEGAGPKAAGEEKKEDNEEDSAEDGHANGHHHHQHHHKDGSCCHHHHHHHHHHHGDSSEDNDDDGHHHDGHDEEEDEELLEAEHEEQVVASLGPAVRISYEPALTAVFNATQAPGLAVRDLVKLVPHREEGEALNLAFMLWREGYTSTLPGGGAAASKKKGGAAAAAEAAPKKGGKAAAAAAAAAGGAQGGKKKQPRPAKEEEEGNEEEQAVVPPPSKKSKKSSGGAAAVPAAAAASKAAARSGKKK